MQLAFHYSSMDGGMGEGDPCSQHKQDICNFVRYRMLSIQASSAQTEAPLVSSIPLHPASTFVLPEILLGSTLARNVFYPGFEISPHYLHLVLRI